MATSLQFSTEGTEVIISSLGDNLQKLKDDQHTINISKDEMMEEWESRGSQEVIELLNGFISNTENSTLTRFFNKMGELDASLKRINDTEDELENIGRN